MDYQDTAPASCYTHSTDVYSVRACLNDKALDLVAIGGENSVEVLQRDLTESIPVFTPIASFYTGTIARSIAWSPRTTSPSAADSWFLELVVAGADNHLRLLLCSPAEEGGDNEPTTEVRMFGSGLSGHHGRINDVCFCTSETYLTHVASAADDGHLILWNLYPLLNSADTNGDASTPGPGMAVDFETGHDTEEETEPSVEPSRKSQSQRRSASRRTPCTGRTSSLEPIAVPEATAYIIKFAHPLHSISSHPSSASQFMVSDTYGQVFLIDWTKLEPNSKPAAWRGHRVVELVDPRALTDGLTGSKGRWTGGASWKRDDICMIGATYGTRWCVWDTRKLQGGKPIHYGEGHEHGGDRFRWCPTDTQLFAISSTSPLGGAFIKVYRTSSPNSPRQFNLSRGPPHRVRDFDWLAGADSEDALRAWVAVAVGRSLFVVAAGDAP